MTKTKKNTHNSTPLETFEQVAFVEHMESKARAKNKLQKMSRKANR